MNVPAGSGVLVKVSDQAPEIGVAWLGATVKDENGVEKEIRAYASAELNVDHYITMFDELEKEYTPKIDALMKQCDEMDITYEYENADYWVFKRFIEYGKDDATLLKKQFDLIDPDIVVYGYTFDAANCIHGLSCQKKQHHNDHWFYKDDSDKLHIDFFHPANHYPALLQYYGLMGIYQKAIKDK